MIEKENKSIWTLDSEFAKRIVQPSGVPKRRCLGAAAPLAGESDWPETPSTADELILVTKGFCGYRGFYSTKLFR
ncbi:MAG: hypothetical protein CL688_00200 [Candidatus Puniceispirillum sp.]|nr:hypothetical protein [Candidatus Puniceispirillum sp.]